MWQTGDNDSLNNYPSDIYPWNYNHIIIGELPLRISTTTGKLSIKIMDDGPSTDLML